MQKTKEGSHKLWQFLPKMKNNVFLWVQLARFYDREKEVEWIANKINMNIRCLRCIRKEKGDIERNVLVLAPFDKVSMKWSDLLDK